MKIEILRTSFAVRALAFQIIGNCLILFIVGAIRYESIRNAVYQEVENSGKSAAMGIKEFLSVHPEKFTQKSLQPVVFRFYNKLSNIEHVSIVDRSSRILADSHNQL